MICSNQSLNRALGHLQANAYDQQMLQNQQQYSQEYSQALCGIASSGIQNIAIGAGAFRFQNLQHLSGQPVHMVLYDAQGAATSIMVDPQMIPYIDAINRHHLANCGINLAQAITRPAMPMTPMPNSEFSLDEMTKAEELLEELNVGAHD